MESIELLPLVKAYPALSRTYGEVCCVAGTQMTDSGPRWIRLYPVPFRVLEDHQQFRKYQRVRLRVATHGGDTRPETRRPDRDSIETVGSPIPTSGSWAKRRRWVEPLMVQSMCEVRRREQNDRTSLAVFRPARVDELVIEERDINADKQAMARDFANQGNLFSGLGRDERSRQLQELEQIPYSFKYRYRCNERGCRGHEQSIIDWEIVQYYRQVRSHDNWRERIRNRWLGELCGDDRDTAFFVGNQHLHRGTFMVLGVWWPPLRPEQLSLTDVSHI